MFTSARETWQDCHCNKLGCVGLCCSRSPFHWLVEWVQYNLVPLVFCLLGLCWKVNSSRLTHGTWFCHRQVVVRGVIATRRAFLRCARALFAYRVFTWNFPTDFFCNSTSTSLPVTAWRSQPTSAGAEQCSSRNCNCRIIRGRMRQNARSTTREKGKGWRRI